MSSRNQDNHHQDNHQQDNHHQDSFQVLSSRDHPHTPEGDKIPHMFETSQELKMLL